MKFDLDFNMPTFDEDNANPSNNRMESNTISYDNDYETLSAIDKTDPSYVSSATVPLSGDLNPYWTLSVPTLFTKLNGYYFIVDCYHNQILYQTDKDLPIDQWHVFANGLSRGHTITTDGTVYMVDNTEQNEILFYQQVDGKFELIKTFNNTGDRPHFCSYDETTGIFYAWSSETGEMFLYQRNSETNEISSLGNIKIDALSDKYVRSFSVIDNKIYFPTSIGTGEIVEVNKNTFAVENTYTVPDNIAGMVQVTKIQDYYYLTVSTDKIGNQAGTIIRTKDLSSLKDGKYEDIYKDFAGKGTPYFITKVDDSYYLTESNSNSHFLYSFNVNNNNITNVQEYFTNNQ